MGLDAAAFTGEALIQLRRSTVFLQLRLSDAGFCIARPVLAISLAPTVFASTRLLVAGACKIRPFNGA